MKKRGIIAILGLSMLLGLTACGSKTETTATETETQTTSVETESVKETKKERPELAEGQMYSYLTGEVSR